MKGDSDPLAAAAQVPSGGLLNSNKKMFEGVASDLYENQNNTMVQNGEVMLEDLQKDIAQQEAENVAALGHANFDDTMQEAIAARNAGNPLAASTRL